MNTSPPTLYHYCSAETFKCIIENKTLRASPLSSMNDSMEHNWLKKLAIEKLTKRYKASKPLNILKSEQQAKQTDFFQEAIFQFRNQSVEDPFAICFSSDGDVLSQWRAYADDGLGFAVGFKQASLSFSFGFELKQVSYDPKKHEKIVDKLISNALAWLENDGSVETAARRLHVEILDPSMICKNPKFSEELEWRVVGEEIPIPDESGREITRTTPSVNSGFRVKDGLFVQFHDFEIENSSITELVLGPKNPAQHNRYSLKRLLANQGFREIAIRNSAASYR